MGPVSDAISNEAPHTMPKGDLPLPSLLRHTLSTVASLEAPSPDLVAHIVQRIRVAAKDEIALGLHALCPYKRHILREDHARTS